jgi:uncharacterized repeat protein (TIGR01451 family)
MQSDWGSAYPGQEINYVIAAQNTRTSGAMRNMRIMSSVPANLEVISASASYGVDPNLRSVPVTVAGNDVTLELDQLRPAEQTIIAIKTKVKGDVAIGARIVSQAQLTFTGIRATAFTNLVTVQVVGAAPTRLAQQPSPTATTGATIGPSPTASATAQPTASATSAPAPSATTGAAAPTVQPPPRAAAPLPETSTGVPIFGFALLGMTLMLRTVRVHRAQSRI